MSIEVFLSVVISCAFSAIAIVLAISAKSKATENDVWQTLRIERVQRRAIDSEKIASKAVERVVNAEKRISAVEELINKEEEEEGKWVDVTPPICCGETNGEKFWKSRHEVLRLRCAELSGEILLLRKENKELKKKQCRKYEKGE